jgi:phage shock protein A
MQISAEDASRIAELSTEVAREERAVAELRAQTAGLEKQAAAIQDKIDGAGEQDSLSINLMLWHPGCTFYHADLLL